MLNQNSFPVDNHNSLARSDQKMLEQQDQIDSLAGSLDQVLSFLQHQKSEGNLEISDLSVITERLIQHTSLIVNNLDVLKNDVDLIKSAIILLNEKIIKNTENTNTGSNNILSGLDFIQKEQSELRSIIVTVKKQSELQQNMLESKLNWKILVASILGTSIITVFASTVSVGIVTSKIYDNDIAVFGKIDRIYEYLNIKNSKRQ